ncbi:hypothetical protein [Microbispora maris]|uniref:hypothetical protein n=1 Tax=Microbispora maris TaxID=3144104 RepID=UPI003D158CDA
MRASNASYTVPGSAGPVRRGPGDFFPRRFPEEKPLVMVCRSWLLDEQPAECLPEDSDIVRFQSPFP